MSRSPSKRFGILLTTSLFIVLAISLYYIYILNVKETKVKKQAFKILYRYASDLREKEKDLLAAQKTKMIELSSYEKSIKFESKNIDTISKYNDKKDTIAEIKKGLNNLIQRKQTLEKDLLKAPVSKNGLYAISRIQNNIDKKREKNNQINKKINQSPKDSIYLKKEELFEDLFSTKLFSHFAVFNKDKVVYSTLDRLNNLKLINQIIAESHSDTIEESNKKRSIFFRDYSQKDGYKIINPSENQIKINIGGEDYQAFIIPVQSKGTSHLVGFIPNTQYLSLKRGFDRGLITAIIVFFTLLLLSIPIIKLMVVAPGETFNIKSLITLIFSGAGVTFLVLFFSIYVSNKIFIKSYIGTDNGLLYNLSNNIKTSFNNELNSMLNQLDSFSMILSDQRISIGQSQLKEKTILEYAENFVKLTIPSRKEIKTKVINQLDSANYPTWLEAFTVSTDSKKMLFAVENSKKWKESPTGIDLSNRDYVNNPNKFQKNNHVFGFESIYSLSTAKPQVVISKKAKSQKVAICMSSEMYTINNVVLPYGYSFCIVDKNGKVWFHENPRNNLRENLLDETNHYPLLETAIKSTRSNTFTCDYKMKSMLMRIDPLDTDLGLFLVTMCNINEYYQIFYQCGYMILGSILLIFSFWFILALLYRWHQKINNTSTYQPHSLLHFFPDKNYAFKYKKMIVLNGIFIFFFIITTIIFFDVIFINHWVRLIALTGGSVLLLNMREVSSKDYECKHIPFIFLVFIEIVFFFVAELILEGDLTSLSIIISNTLLVSINCILFFIIKLKAHKSSSEKPYFNIYFTYIFSVLLVTLLVPLFTVYTTMFHQEITMYLMHQQRHVADKVIERQILFSIDKKDIVVDTLNTKGQYFTILQGMKKYNEGCKMENNSMATTNNYVRMFGDTRSAISFINNIIEDRGNRIKPNYITSSDGLYEYSNVNNKLCLTIKKGGYPNNPDTFSVEVTNPNLFYMGNRYWGFAIGFILILILFAIFFPIIGHYLFPRLKYSRDLFLKNDSIKTPIPNDKRYLITIPDKELYNNYLKNENSELFIFEGLSGYKDFIKYNKRNKDIFLFINEKFFSSLITLNEFVDCLENMINENLQRSVTFVCFKIPPILLKSIKERLKYTVSDESFVQLNTLLYRFKSILSSSSLTYIPPQ